MIISDIAWEIYYMPVCDWSENPAITTAKPFSDRSCIYADLVLVLGADVTDYKGARHTADWKKKYIPKFKFMKLFKLSHPISGLDDYIHKSKRDSAQSRRLINRWTGKFLIKKPPVYKSIAF